MSLSNAQVQVPAVRWAGLTPVQFAVIATVFSILGVSTIWPTMQTLWFFWTTDALKSVGIAVPLVSLVLILRAWRALGWAAEGTWLGLILLLIASVGAWAQRMAVLILVISPHWSTAFPPPSLVLLAYGTGLVLLLGGYRLLRAALFPVLLLWFANPIPHAFSLLVDLPLQTASAHVARSFAMHLGYTLTPDHLRLMFTPDFGMFIAPGCDGIRGSLTMGFIAVIAGYLCRFRWYWNAVTTLAAILLGYVFNFVRLCLLVLYYVVALHFPFLQDKAKNADYCIGASLFLIATLLLFTTIHHFRRPSVLSAPDRGELHRTVVSSSISPAQYTRLVVLGLVILLGFIGWARASGRPLATPQLSEGTDMQFPARLGNYTLARSWNETLLSGPVVYRWAEYVPAGGGIPVALGLSPELDLHDPLICHSVRGDNPSWQGQISIPTADPTPASFHSALYANGVSQYLEASAQCDDRSCNESKTDRTYFGFIYSRPEFGAPFRIKKRRSVPLLIRLEISDTQMPPAAARELLTENLRAFLGPLSLNKLVEPLSTEHKSSSSLPE